MYSESQRTEIFDKICERIEKGESLYKILSDENMPSSQTFYIWIDTDELKSKKYARATELRSERIFEEILEISDTPVEGIVLETDDNGRTKEKRGDMLGHRRLQVDSRKWMLSKMMPKKYGEKLDIDHTTKGNQITLTPEQRKAELTELKRKLLAD